MTWGFIKGQVYNRRADIHARFRGQMQGGIITPAGAGLPIIIITGEEGHAHGYADRLREDGVFEYFGEGQRGDMQMVRGNAAIQSHASEGRDLLLFRKQKQGLRYLGQFIFEASHTELAPDTEGRMRNAIVFELSPFEAVAGVPDDVTIDDTAGDLTDLRRRAIEASRSVPAQGQRLTTVYERSKLICSYVFARANGTCEFCSSPAPFLRANGVPYLEAHHIHKLTDGGPDDPRTMIGICPNCHRRAHSAADRDQVNAAMLQAVQTREA
ncbi:MULTISPECIES: HNH endonuclease [unclassified Paracoccus (in: a-proteobacteria)]|uniref:HNH endonuclease n=1 Tax=unclassified Paracoccus (in: a-proteobacteria) TaxID=2688777 RepID=UPI000A020482|nr:MULTISPECIES: HNH endonuclease [unclassified Paracoccus (in: a-proteobacteria)]